MKNESVRPTQWTTATRGLLLAIALAGHTDAANAQGCVAVRGGGMCSLQGHPDSEEGVPQAGEWQAAIGYRWLHSDRHFVGDREQTQRQDQNTEVINDSHFFDLGITYNFTPRYSATLVAPFVHSDRSSLYEHKGNNSGERYHTQAGGLGDLRLAAYSWIWDPTKAKRGNIQVGLGLKAPTGVSDAKDIFIRGTNSTPTLDYVDQSIQPGDGGWGFTVELNGWLKLCNRAYAYAQGYYLLNPENINGTPTRIANVNSTNVFNFMSVPDQYMARGGVAFALIPKWGITASLGGRLEGIPVEDIIGDSEGFRRPGFSVGIEPGISWMKSKWTAAITAPVAVYRNRERSVRDMMTGGHGDAAFADFVITASVARRF